MKVGDRVTARPGYFMPYCPAYVARLREDADGDVWVSLKSDLSSRWILAIVPAFKLVVRES